MLGAAIRRRRLEIDDRDFWRRSINGEDDIFYPAVRCWSATSPLNQSGKEKGGKGDEWEDKEAGTADESMTPQAFRITSARQCRVERGWRRCA